MSREGDPITGLTLNEFRAQMGMHPWHFFGMADDNLLRVTPQCPTVLRRYAWQDTDQVGRADILTAIASAESKLLRYLGYRPFPMYAEAVLPWPVHGDTQMWRGGAWGTDGRWLSVALPEGEIRAVGVEARTLIQASAAVVLTDPDGDGVSDLATVVVPTAVAANEIAVYVAAASILIGDPLSERYRIRPVNVTISGGNAIIRFPAWLLVRPDREEGVSVDDLDPAAVSTLAVAVDVYRRYTNASGTTATTAGAVIEWETTPLHGWWCCCSGCSNNAFAGSPYDPAAIAQAAARVGLRDARLGIVTPAEAAYDSTTGVWSALDWSVCHQPDRVTVRYLAGVASPDGQRIAAEWQPIVARLAAAELARPICSCEPANREVARWQFDLARSAGANDEMYMLGTGDLDNPLGTRRGHVEAWKWIQRRQLTRGIYAG